MKSTVTAPAWGMRAPGAGRASHVSPGMEYQGTTVQLCGLFPVRRRLRSTHHRSADRTAHAVGRSRLPRPPRMAPRRPHHQPRHIRPRPTRRRQVHRRQTPHHRHDRIRHQRPDPRRHQTRLHPTRRTPRRAGHPSRTRPGPPQPPGLRPARHRPRPHGRRRRPTTAPGDPRPPHVTAAGAVRPGTRTRAQQHRRDHPRPRHRRTHRTARHATPPCPTCSAWSKPAPTSC